LNENTNELVRQYLKKGCDFSQGSEKQLVIIMINLIVDLENHLIIYRQTTIPKGKS